MSSADQHTDITTDGAPTVPFREGITLLWSYSRPHTRTLAAGVLLGLFATSISLATPMVTKWVLDSLGTDLDLAKPVAVLVIILIVGIVANLAQSILIGRLAEHIVLDARRGLIERFFFAKLEQIQKFRSGELVTRVTSDTLLLREATTNSLIQLINGFVSLIGTIVLMAILDWSLLVTTLVAIVIVGCLFGVLVPQIGKADKRAQDAVGHLGARLEGGVRAMRTVKSSRAEVRQIEHVNEKAEESARYAIRSVWFSALTWTVAGGGMQLAVIVILGLGAGRVAMGQLAVSTLVAFLLYAFNIVDPIVSLAGAISTLQRGLAAAARIRETAHLELEDVHARSKTSAPSVADQSGRVDLGNVARPGNPTGAVDSMKPASRAETIDLTTPNAPTLNPPTTVLALRNVTASYADAQEPAVRGVTLTIPRRGHVALVGPSGAGKTTVFSLLLRFIDPVSGKLELSGIPYEELSLDDIRSRIAYVEQETPVIPGTVRQCALSRARSN
ncbi:ABC transporter ATP-binding protein [Schaalia vaccimaxillae]|uniref:ABC transporter ATP-binding protein n=1 Tax=Schaalia vaccimaxillae TaxID=183916 RepID=UPI00042581D1|nr:ABC transporter ATP-binding protein [Schaalia vaccimaxillae]